MTTATNTELTRKYAAFTTPQKGRDEPKYNLLDVLSSAPEKPWKEYPSRIAWIAIDGIHQSSIPMIVDNALTDDDVAATLAATGGDKRNDCCGVGWFTQYFPSGTTYAGIAGAPFTHTLPDGRTVCVAYAPKRCIAFLIREGELEPLRIRHHI